MFVYKWPQKILIYVLIASFLLANFGLAQTGHAVAATVSFSTPGKWYINTKGDLINEIQMTKDGVKSTVNWTYHPYGGIGTFIYKSLGADTRIENVWSYRLDDNGDSEQYFAFVKTEGGKKKVFEIGQLTQQTWGVNFSWLEGSMPNQASRWMRFTRAQGDTTTELRQYIKAETPLIKASPAEVLSASSTGITADAKNACENLLIKPFSQSGDPLYEQVFKPINDKMGRELLKLSSAADQDLYKKFFKSTSSIDISDAYIDDITKSTYQNFVGEFQKAETGWMWMWTDNQTAREKEDLIRAVANFNIILPVVSMGQISFEGGSVLLNMPIDFLKNKVNQSAWAKLARLLTAKAYIEAHMKYDRCIESKMTDTPFDLAKEEENLKAIFKLAGEQEEQITDTQEEADAAAQVNADLGNPLCNAYKVPILGKIAGLLNPLAYLICGLINGIQDIMNWLLNSDYGLKEVF